MSRPYFKKRILELEEIFQNADADREVLETLNDELKHRKTRRARRLHPQVQARLAELRQPVSTPPPRPASAPGSKGQRVAAPKRVRGGGVRPEPPTPSRPLPSREPVSASAPNAGVGSGEGSEDGLEARTPTLRSGTSSPTTPDAGLAPREVEDLLAAWTVVEVLDPNPMPDPKQLAFGRRLIRQDEHPEPWLDPAYGARGREKEVYWWIHLGQLDLARATASLLKLFPDDRPERPPRTKGEAPMAVVVLDGEGKPQADKSFLASFPWGYGMVRKGRLRELSEFPQRERPLCAELEKRLIRQDEDGEVLPVSRADLARVSEWLLGRLDVPVEEVSMQPVAMRVPQWRRAFSPPEPELLNSFFLQDLARVREAFRQGGAGAAISAFVGQGSSQPRVDVARQPKILEQTLAPHRTPLVRWPVRGDHSLVMMQQAAVNHAVDELAEQGLVGINGPPGTGKTTLLRDVVAHVVLERAKTLAGFDDPNDAFQHQTPMKVGRAFLHLYRLDPALLGHEIVVASSNNKAVENVSREIPSLAAVEDHDDRLRYFASVANRLAGSLPSGESDPEGATQCWGLAAAVLGNKANVRDFVQGFWWDDEWSMQQYLRGVAEGWTPPPANGEGGEDDEDLPPAVLIHENAPLDAADALQRWRKTRKRFKQVQARAEKVRRELEATREALHKREEVEAALTDIEAEIEGHEGESSRLEGEGRSLRNLLEKAREVEDRARSDRDAVRQVRPHFLARWFFTRSYRQWRPRMSAAVDAVEAALVSVRKGEEVVERNNQEMDRLAEVLRIRRAERRNLRDRFSKIRELLSAGRRALGEHLPDARFWDRPEVERQKLSPWLSAEFQQARKELFIAAFDLHRAFIDAAAKPLRHNLGAMMELLKDRTLSAKQEPARRSLWASLFLVVPVVSTTFASAARLFGPLGREQLGWLLVDEAGQTVPQAAAGSMWRSQRVIGIGDPLQIEPVVTLSPRLIDSVFEENDVDADAWSAPRNSVQTLADRTSWFGTALQGGDVWVGAPLKVHRRCQQPMFGISNRIAYDRLMVQATPESPSPVGSVLGDSAWFDVPGSAAGHWSPAEGEVAAGMLQQVVKELGEIPELFFITPFRLCMNKLRGRLRPVADAVPGGPPAWPWVNDAVGTIHTFQGREADTVVLVLGAPGAAAQGARAWAGGTPNLLNVAVSRAKRRLYVVGSHGAWKDAGVFRFLAAALPRKTFG